MIKFADEKIINFVNWLNKYYPTSQDVQFSILVGYDCVGNDDKIGFAIYGNTDDYIVIFCADPQMVAKSCELSEDDMWETALTNIAHEYRHHIQATEFNWSEEEMNSDKAENDAEEWSDFVYKDYINGDK